MKTAIYDKGLCGIEQSFYIGTVNKDTDAAEGTQLPVQLPAGSLRRVSALLALALT